MCLFLLRSLQDYNINYLKYCQQYIEGVKRPFPTSRRAHKINQTHHDTNLLLISNRIHK